MATAARWASLSASSACTSPAGPITAGALAATLAVRDDQIETALLALESEGVVLRGRFTPDGSAGAIEWCDRALLARIHRYTLNRLRAEIEALGWEMQDMPDDGFRLVKKL